MCDVDMSAIRMDNIDLASLAGKSILLTGGASGLGLATARSFAAAGAYVTIADIQDESTVGMRLLEEFAALGQHVNYVRCDVTNWDSQVSSFRSAINFSPHKVLNVVAMFAGVTSEPGNIMDHIIKVDLDLDQAPGQPEIQCLQINLIGVYYSAYLALHYFRFKPQDTPATNPPTTISELPESLESIPNDLEGLQASENTEQTQKLNNPRNSDAAATNGLENGNVLPSTTKSLIFINSLAGYVDLPKHTTYNISKFGARGLFRSIRGYARKWDVRCNLIAPWHIRTPMTEAIQAFMKKHNVPEGQGINWANIQDVVDAVGKCAVSEDLSGRAFAVMPEGVFDMKDDLDTEFGGKELKEIMRVRREAGDTIA